MDAMETAAVGEERFVSEVEEIETAEGGREEAPSPALPHGARGREERQGEEGGNGALSPTLSHEPFSGAARGREAEEADAPGSPAEPADSDAVEHEQSDATGAEGADWRGRAEVAEERVAELGDRLGAVEAAADDLRRIVGESERARQVDRELLIAGVVDLDSARSLVEEQVDSGATVLEAVSRVKERRPLLFVARARGGRGVRATVMPAVEGGGSRAVDEVAEAARETGDRRLLLRYLRMRRGEG